MEGFLVRNVSEKLQVGYHICTYETLAGVRDFSCGGQLIFLTRLECIV